MSLVFRGVEVRAVPRRTLVVLWCEKTGTIEVPAPQLVESAELMARLSPADVQRVQAIASQLGAK